ncbi:hypothetical protein MA5S0422_1796 [Mycobacteroides abscessus 5S-0422]|uniref:Uncharacterized protein n=1 Tax=Mycobacteroides abscessus subsp. bolletii 1513 TaxID=1299321 RepID=X8DRN2_9MYCO|nr:hypothetical protein MA5S0304_0811 [Mycobacteroides abscessus 5S-0304]EIU16549.1 hypothetical protein MA5S0421_1061 [Mycobacteroides abscessus 5S-0421]EIU18176.1 hypothetical protein MA5S0422_1796 [Mycobacteroides abscessus 5S-0422]EIU28518.1 hypothetical protein MA5S0708_1288 [Mycobacteroides abscessus 5S-0708]EIU33393.1 hypothetical protein MA5S0817_0841 [Mycobacteroides abscessus 5S-0817]EIU33786.1 hypothetical protein MA5S1212_1231 [Mycobacteroides abscessus 5S-1212]EIU41877.1 hypothet
MTLLATIPSSGAHLNILERPNGSLAVQQSGRHILLTLSEAQLLAIQLLDIVEDSYPHTR